MTSQYSVTYGSGMARNADRTLHLVDIENLVGTPAPKASEVAGWRRWYIANMVEDGDLVVVASSHHAFRVVGFEWCGVRHVVRSGQDGADLALLDVLDAERVTDRFEKVVIASGDGIFMDAAAALGARDVDVTVVANAHSASKRLLMAARFNVLVGQPHVAATNEEAR